LSTSINDCCCGFKRRPKKMQDETATIPTRRTLRFRRTDKSDSIAGTTVIETDLPGHPFEYEYTPDYVSYLIETAADDAAEEQVMDVKRGDEVKRKDYLKVAKEHKDKGNSLFRLTDKYHDAIRQYQRSIHSLRRLPKDTPQVRELRITCYVNMCACDLSLNDFAAARRHASKAIKLDPQNVKAYYRRAVARQYAAFDLDGAERDLVQAVQLAPNDDSVKRALETFRKKLTKSTDDEAAVAKRMFS